MWQFILSTINSIEKFNISDICNQKESSLIKELFQDLMGTRPFHILESLTDGEMQGKDTSDR